MVFLSRINTIVCLILFQQNLKFDINKKQRIDYQYNNF